MTTEQNVKVNVKGGRYVGKKWFIKFPYKVIETDVDFFDNKVSLSQGSGFVKASYKTPSDIVYTDIYSVLVKRKYSIPNIILAIFTVLGALITEVWFALVVAAVVVWIGSTAVAIIQHSGGNYEVPTEFKSEAEELQAKFNAAISQSKM